MTRVNASVITMLTITFICLLFSSFLAQQIDTQYISHGGIGGNENSTLVRSANLSCPGVWSIFDSTNGNTSCSCGNYLGRVIRCDKRELLSCFCMTPYAKDPNITVVGACMYKCRLPVGRHYNVLPSSASELSMYMCNSVTGVINGTPSWNRDGQLCGKCKQGFVPPAYSYDWHCVKCSYDEYSVVNLVKYCIIVFLPLTIFFIALVTLRISATSPSMNAFVLVCQMLSSPLQIRLFLSAVDLSNHTAVKAFDVIASLLGFWNLDFFRTLYSPFCLHPNMSTLQVLALDYIIAAYPLLLIAVTYFLVELHDRNCRIIVWLWKPFRRCFIHIGRMFVRTSLVEAFASFLLLSYVRFLSVSFGFLVPTHVYNVYGESLGPYLYYDGTVEYFGKQHFPYAILAIVVLIIFNILPLLLLCLYPCHCFQKIINLYSPRCHALHTFMDAFQGHYKNGTNGTRDCRYFSAMYLLVRIAFFIIAALALTSSVIMVTFITGVLFALFLILIAVVKPYQSSTYNAVDVVLCLALSLYYFSTVAIEFALTDYIVFAKIIGCMICILGLVPLLYMTIVILSWLFRKLSLETQQRWCLTFPPLKWIVRQSNSEEPLPERLVNPEECAELLHEPVSEDQGKADMPSFEQ